MRINKYILLILFSYLCLNIIAQDKQKLQGKIAPGFKLESTEGEVYSLKELTRKGPVLISFMGVGCVISKVKPFINARGYIFPVLLDPNGEVASSPAAECLRTVTK